MFTGLIEAVGEVVALTPRPTGARLTVVSRHIVADAKEGDSICVNGVCLTALDVDAQTFTADLAPETLARTSLGQLKTGDALNLERSLLPTSRLGGHIVQGHVDGTGVIHSIQELGDGIWWLTVDVPPELDRYIVFKGSIAIEGISLTVAAIENLKLSVTIIPHTWTHTNLHRHATGHRVNLETDVIARYVEKMLAK